MNSTAKIAKFITDDGFWQSSESLALKAGKIEKSKLRGLPDNHLLFATSGSGGDPKWIALSKEALLLSANAVNIHLNVTPDSTWGLALPPWHVGGFGVIARSIEISCKLQVFPYSWDPHRFTMWLDSERVSHTSLVPTQVHDLVSAGCAPTGPLLAVVVGGGRLEQAIGHAARSLGWPLLASYGMTEAGSQIATQPLAALGEPYCPEPIPVLSHWKVRNDPDGCLEISGPALFSGTATAGNYIPRAPGWYSTRDRVSITAQGLVPEGRADAMVKIAGELVDPGKVECSIRTRIGTFGEMIAVATVKDKRLGNRMILYAEAEVPEHMLIRAVREYDASVPRSQRLGVPHLVEKLPRSVLGKIQRHKLRLMPRS